LYRKSQGAEEQKVKTLLLIAAQPVLSPTHFYVTTETEKKNI